MVVIARFSEAKMKTALVLVALLSAAVAVPERPGRIVGGTDTTIQEYNFMASLHYGWFGTIWVASCAGTMLTSSTMLSAAHCFLGDEPISWRSQLGSTLSESGGLIIPFREIVLHELYDNFDHDVAIVRLSSSAPLGANIGTAEIAGANYVLGDGVPLTLVGWGDTEHQGWPSSVLQHVEVVTMNQAQCAERYAYLKTLPGYGAWPDVTERMFCAGVPGAGGRDACQGDSGGPALHGRVAYGVISWGFECANDTYPGVHAAVHRHAQWIVANGSG